MQGITNDIKVNHMLQEHFYPNFEEELFLNNIFLLKYNYAVLKNKTIEGKVNVFFNEVFLTNFDYKHFSVEGFKKGAKKTFLKKLFSNEIFNIEKPTSYEIQKSFISLFSKENFIVLLNALGNSYDIENLTFKKNNTNDKIEVPFYNNGFVKKNLIYGVGYSEKNFDLSFERAFCNAVENHFNTNYKSDDMEELINIEPLLNEETKEFYDVLTQNCISDIYCFKCKNEYNIPLYKFYFLNHQINPEIANSYKEHNILSYKYICSFDLQRDFKNLFDNISNRYYLFLNEIVDFLSKLDFFFEEAFVKPQVSFKEFIQSTTLCILKHEFEYLGYKNCLIVIPEYIKNNEIDSRYINNIYSIQKSYSEGRLDLDFFENMDFKSFMGQKDFLSAKTINDIFDKKQTHYLLKNDLSIVNFYSTYIYAVYTLATGQIQEFLNYIIGNNIQYIPYKLTDANLFSEKQLKDKEMNGFIACIVIYLFYLADPKYNINMIFKDILYKIYEKEIVDEFKQCLNNPNLFFTTPFIYSNLTKDDANKLIGELYEQTIY